MQEPALQHPQNLLELELRPSELVLKTLEKAGHHLGVSLANLSVALDPDIIYLAVEPQMASRILLDQVTKSFQTYRLKLTPQVIPLHFLTEPKMCALGAAGFAVDRLLDLLSVEADH
jgi:predicted NBD/HSP70 family sugar kinase